MVELTTRKRAERAFHDARFETEQSDTRVRLNKWYGAANAAIRAQSAMLHSAARNARVLEFGCADGRLSLFEGKFAQVAKRFDGIDLSDCAIERARKHAAGLGLEHCTFTAMDAERTAFDENAFDLVFGRGIIHHLELSRAFNELQRVLRPGGRAIFLEPMGHNPLINRFRQRTPEMRTPDEHPLLVRDFDLAREYFRRVETRYFGLTTLGVVAITNDGQGGWLMRTCEAVDDLVLKLPGVGPNAWMVLMTMTK
jgi:SAM-dependent methyltransferase